MDVSNPGPPSRRWNLNSESTPFWKQGLLELSLSLLEMDWVGGRPEQATVPHPRHPSPLGANGNAPLTAASFPHTPAVGALGGAQDGRLRLPPQSSWRGAWSQPTWTLCIGPHGPCWHPPAGSAPGWIRLPDSQSDMAHTSPIHCPEARPSISGGGAPCASSTLSDCLFLEAHSPTFVLMGPTWVTEERLTVSETPSPELKETNGLDSHRTRPGARGREARVAVAQTLPAPPPTPVSGREGGGGGLSNRCLQESRPGFSRPASCPSSRVASLNTCVGGNDRKGHGGQARSLVFSLLVAVGVRMTREPADCGTRRVSGVITAGDCPVPTATAEAPCPQDGKTPVRVSPVLSQQSATCWGAWAQTSGFSGLEAQA